MAKDTQTTGGCSAVISLSYGSCTAPPPPPPPAPQGRVPVHGRAPDQTSAVSVSRYLATSSPLLFLASITLTSSFPLPLPSSRRNPLRLRRTSIPARRKTIGPKDTAPSSTRRPPPTPSVRHSRLPVSSARHPNQIPYTPSPACCFTTASLCSPPSFQPETPLRPPKDPRPWSFRHRPPSAVAVVWTAALHSSPSSSAPLGSRIPHQLPTSATTSTTTTTRLSSTLLSPATTLTFHSANLLQLQTASHHSMQPAITPCIRHA
ncbi:hypothetical protein IWX90DRAFT_498072 [Phyllosticta citrichinensis]|uniref:Uncharacterized protein n=1 Tax=Phyllosticta citrichinensis TaxID=1130410 RepID=A0ABR1Y3U7_9PEZI